MRKYVIMGVQGSGKGTQAKLLAADLDLVHIAVGDIFRWNVQHHTKLGAQVRRTMAAGLLVSDDLVEGVVRGRLSQHDWNYGFIVDGFPRNVKQAEALAAGLERVNLKLDKVVAVIVPDEEIVKRISGRRTCRNCDAMYHVLFEPPAKPGVCDKCGGEMRRVKDVLDVWFESGVASWASLGYPAREDEFKRWWPAKWIVEGPDQTRGWFNSQLALSVMAFDRAPYDSVLTHGWVNGPDGRQMHKSLGNVIEPSTVIAKFGVDPLRFYVVSVNAIWEDITFQEEGVRTCQRTLNILWNVLRFATTYMVLDRFDPSRDDLTSLGAHLRPEDRWLLSRLEGLRATFDKEMESYALHRAYRAVDAFILDDLSRWYVKLARERTWIDADDKGKLAVYHVLYETLLPGTTRSTGGGLLPYAGVPETVVVEAEPPPGQSGESAALTGAGLPGVATETIVVDHGKIYLSEHLLSVCQRLGISVQLARPLTPTDKPRVAYCTSSG